MALGGIAVSGGTSGNGTLISTNLLYSPLLYDAYGNALARPAFTLGGTAGAAGFEAAWAIDQDPATLYKTAASAGAITMTIVPTAPIRQVYGIVLVWHNLDGGSADPPLPGNFTSAKFEGGAGNYTDLSKDLVVNAASLTPAYYLLSAAEIAAAASYTQWRITVTFASSTALQIGEVFLIGAAPLAFARNYSWQGDDGFVSGQVISDGENGVPRISALWRRREKALTFDRISTAQKEALELAALNGHCILSPDGSDGPAHFGIIQLAGRPKEMLPGQWTMTMRFIEAAR
jgi:hypothetical protein